MVVCEPADPEHGRRRDAPTPAEVLAAALARPSVERSATEVLRDELARSEDLVVLVPQLEQARALIDEAAGPDRREELAALRYEHERLAWDHPVRAAAERLDRAQAATARARAEHERAWEAAEDLGRRRWWRRPDPLAVTQARAAVEGTAAALAWAVREEGDAAAWADKLAATRTRDAARLGEAERALTAREDWLAAHPAEAAWEADLAHRVAERTEELGRRAEEVLPAHVVRLAGPPPQDPAGREPWREAAGAVEAYRERWRVEPGRLGAEEGLRGNQARHW